jgi:hypothetical protein
MWKYVVAGQAVDVGEAVRSVRSGGADWVEAEDVDEKR